MARNGRKESTFFFAGCWHRAPGDDLGQMRCMPSAAREFGLHFRQHLAVVGGRAEELRIEGQHEQRLDAERVGEFLDRNFRPLGHAHLIEHELAAARRWRAALTHSRSMFLALRKEARSGVATMTISSAASSVWRAHGVQACGRSRTTQGVDAAHLVDHAFIGRRRRLRIRGRAAPARRTATDARRT